MKIPTNSGGITYIHPTTDGNKHVPVTSTTNDGKVLTAGASAGVFTWQTPSAGHTQGTDTGLDTGGGHAVTAETIVHHIAETTTAHGGIPSIVGLLDETAHDILDHTGLTGVLTRVSSVILTMAGVLTTYTGSIRWYPPRTMTLSYIHASVGTTPTGANLNISIEKDGVEATTCVIVAGTYTGVQTVSPAVSYTTSNYITIDIDQIGSTVAGADLVIRMDFTE